MQILYRMSAISRLRLLLLRLLAEAPVSTIVKGDYFRKVSFAIFRYVVNVTFSSCQGQFGVVMPLMAFVLVGLSSYTVGPYSNVPIVKQVSWWDDPVTAAACA